MLFSLNQSALEEMKSIVLSAIEIMPRGASDYGDIWRVAGRPQGEAGALFDQSIIDLNVEGKIERIVDGDGVMWRLKRAHN